MSVNKEAPHVIVLPEDDANRQIANGFLLYSSVSGRNIQVINPAGGWLKVLESFKNNHTPEMRRYPKRFMILLIDLDEKPLRLNEALSEIPSDLADRVFILGVWSNPEKLRTASNMKFEPLGSAMAKDCQNNTNEIWSHNLLHCNANELKRLQTNVSPFLFTSV